MKEIRSVTVDEKRDRVTIVVVDRDSWGSIRSRKQMTFRKRGFESALRVAEMTIPWQDVAQ